MNRLIALLALMLALVLTGCSVQVTNNGVSVQHHGCNYTASYQEEIAAGDAKQLEVNARAGNLTIVGKEGITHIRVEGRMCTSDERLLNQMGITTKQDGERVQVDVLLPNMMTNASAWVDLTIEVPAHMTARVDDSSGSTIIEGMAALDLTKGSGDLTLSDIKGKVTVHEKSSGRIVIRKLGDDLILGRIGSGDLDVQGVSGSVQLDSKSSGSTRVEETGRSVVLGNIGSGDLRVSGTGAQVILREKSSGLISISRVKQDVILTSVGSGDLDLLEIGGGAELGEKSSGTVRINGVGQALTLGSIGSGDLDVRKVDGEVLLRQKSSGSIRITGVGKHVELDRIGSGDLTVRQVAGDLTVRSKSSGSVSYSEINGRVQVPQR